MIDGATNTTTKVSAGTQPIPLAVNPVTNKIYVVNTGGTGSGSVTVITEQQVQPVPLTTTIAPLPGNQVLNPFPPIFRFAATSSYMPIAPPVQNVYSQVDTWQGRWRRAEGSAPNFGDSTSSLLPGIHIVYAYATDGQFADSIQTGSQSSPIIGAIAAYVFLVVPSGATTTLSLTSGANPSTLGQSLTFTATIGPSISVLFYTVNPTGTVQFQDGGSNLGSPVTVSNSTATFTTAALSVGAHSITAVYSGDANFAPGISPPFAQAVMATSGTGTSTSLTATPKTFFRGSALFLVAVNSSTSSPPSGTAILLDGNKQLGPLLAISSTGNTGIALYITPLNIGEHHIRAVFLGTTGLSSGSFSTTQTVNASPRPKPR